MGMLSFCSILCLQLFLLHSLSCCSAFPSCRKDQSITLLDFKNSFPIQKPHPFFYDSDSCDYYYRSSYLRTSTWENGTNCCSWDGVTCNSLGHVIGLDLSCSWLHGKIHPNNTLFHLTHLQSLNLALNDFQGSHISSQFAQLVSLTHLDLFDSNFSGEVPPQISHLPKLVSLNLSDNYLSLKPNTWKRLITNLTNIRELHLSFIDMSSIPPSHLFKNLSSSLVSLWLSYTGLHGDLKDNICCFPPLQELSLAGNRNLTGYLPKSNWTDSLRYLYLHRTGFMGELPHSIGRMKSLQGLDLSACQFAGKIPESFWNLTLLSDLDLSYNNFSGRISSSLSNLQHLTSLYLLSNNFNGEFPWSPLSRLENLTYLDISNNSFQGNLPDKISGFSNLARLDLSHNSLNETIPYWCLSLPSLKTLDLSFNQFSSQIGEISSYSLKFLDLSNNKLHGLFPRSIFYLKNLTFLDLSHNLLQGQLDLTLPVSTAFISLSYSNLTGGISSSICNASSLKILNLSYNNFTGTIPQCIGSSGLALSVLDLHMNSFSGTIPKSFEAGNKLRTLNLNGNLLEGSLPQSLVNCTVLNVLDLGRNSIEDAFPHWLQTLQELQVLVLSKNKLHGSITNFKDQTDQAFPKLRVFDLSSNNLGGPLPTALFKSFKAMMNVHEGEAGLQYINQNSSGWGTYQDTIEITWKGSDIQLEKILTIFTSIDISNNMFEGEIPQVIGELGLLKGLNLSHNRLTGAIPKSLGNLRNLESLDLSSNKLTREIPMELTDLNSLSVLNLSQNQLNGCIPRGKQFETFTSDSFEGNIGLHGFQVSRECSTDERKKPIADSENGFEFEFGWKPGALGYGCGVVFGASVGWVMIMIRKPRWLVSLFERPLELRKRKTRNCGR